MLLDAPSYVYEDLLWMDRAIANDNTTYHDWMWEEGMATSKHADDYFFAKAAIQHPMRTQDPKSTQLFVVSIPSNEVAEQLILERRDYAWKTFVTESYLEKHSHLSNCRIVGFETSWKIPGRLEIPSTYV